jgi:hypothetical protein
MDHTSSFFLQQQFFARELKEPKDHDAAVLMIMMPQQNHLQVYWIALEQEVSNSSVPKKKLLL